MSSTGLISAAQIESLSAPTVRYTLFGKFEFATGTKYLHAGSGPLTSGGQTWQGVTDPSLPSRLVKIGMVQLPEPNVAAIVQITLTGIDSTFIAAVKADAAEIQGRGAELYLQVLDEDFAPSGDPISFFPGGTMTAPTIAKAEGVREITLGIEGMWSAKNFAPGAMWSNFDHQRRHPGDLIFQYTSLIFEESWP